MGIWTRITIRDAFAPPDQARFAASTWRPS
jgi:hypothetical protein